MHLSLSSSFLVVLVALASFKTAAGGTFTCSIHAMEGSGSGSKKLWTSPAQEQSIDCDTPDAALMTTQCTSWFETKNAEWSLTDISQWRGASFTYADDICNLVLKTTGTWKFGAFYNPCDTTETYTGTERPNTTLCCDDGDYVSC